MAVTEQNSQKGSNNAAFIVLRWIVVIMGIFIVCNIFFPAAVSAILNFIWIVLLVIVAVFLGLGVLVVLGLRKEAAKILDILMEGSLSFVDFLAFLKLIWQRFLMLLREFILFITPVLAFLAAAIIYTLLLLAYKQIGKTYDITFFTVVLSMALVMVVGILNKPTKIIPDLTKWFEKVKKSFKSAFIDGLEVVIFVFFLTMDSTNLFFLPPHLNIPLNSEFRGYDLMLRSFVMDEHLIVTIAIIVAAITLEILRNLLRVGAVARMHYVQDYYVYQQQGIVPLRSTRVKNAIRKSFNQSKDELVKFITFTTVLFAVFLAFPRLKIVTLAAASIASLILDIIFTDRLFASKGGDLLSRILGKIFKI